MAKGGLFTGQMRGKLGDTVYYRRKGEQVVRMYNKQPANANTRSQVQQRSQLANIIRIYQASPVFFKKAFANKPSKQTDYNALVSRNLNGAFKVYLPKSVADDNGGVVAPYIISDGSLTPIVVSGTGVDAITSLAVGADFTIDGTTTVGALSAALIDNNTIVQAGDQLSYLSIEQYNANGVPRLRARLFEMVVDTTSSDLVYDVMPEQAVNVVGGFIAHGELVYSGAFAWVLSRKTTSGLQVSRQQLICTSETLYNAYVGNDAITRAEVSYGANQDVFLDPSGSASGSSVPSVAVSIAEVQIGSTNLTTAVSTCSISGGAIPAGSMTITGSGLTGLTAISATFYSPSSSPLEDDGKITTISVPLTVESDTAASNTSEITLTGITSINGLKITANGRVVFEWAEGATGSGGQNPTPLG